MLIWLKVDRSLKTESYFFGVYRETEQHNAGGDMWGLDSHDYYVVFVCGPDLQNPPLQKGPVTANR